MGRASSFALLNTLFLLMSLCSLLNVDAALLPQRPDLSFYVFRRTPPLPNPTLALIYPPGRLIQAPPPGMPAVTVADHPLRETEFETSPEIGRQRVIRVQGFFNEDQNMTQASGVLDFRTQQMNGTISFSGIQTTGLNIPPMEELAVVGGTGMYRYANGHVKVYLISNVGGNVILRWDVYLCKKSLLCEANPLLG